jgi:hypothetical protein
MKKLIAFTGRAGSGKDLGAFSWASLYKEETGQKTIKFAFADILKDIAGTALGVNLEEAEALKRMPSIKVANQYSLREFYNTLGDSIKSYFGFNIWAKLTLSKIEQLINVVDTDLIVITDLRYVLEQDYLEEFCEKNNIKLIIVKMINSNHTKRSDNIEHESEFQVDDIRENYIIEASSAEEVQEKIKEIYNATADSTTADPA